MGQPRLRDTSGEECCRTRSRPRREGHCAACKEAIAKPKGQRSGRQVPRNGGSSVQTASAPRAGPYAVRVRPCSAAAPRFVAPLKRKVWEGRLCSERSGRSGRRVRWRDPAHAAALRWRETDTAATAPVMVARVGATHAGTPLGPHPRRCPAAGRCSRSCHGLAPRRAIS